MEGEMLFSLGGFNLGGGNFVVVEWPGSLVKPNVFSRL